MSPHSQAIATERNMSFSLFAHNSISMLITFYEAVAFLVNLLDPPHH